MRKVYGTRADDPVNNEVPMPTNIEIKARVDDLARLRERVKMLAPEPAEVLKQHDVFFRAQAGRLKLRILGPSHGELIAYERSDSLSPTASQYQIVPSSEPMRLRAALASALGEMGSVIKRREVYMVDQTRVHLDQVDELGTFMELEFVLAEGTSHKDGVATANDIMSKLGVSDEDLIACAYIDLIRQRGHSTQ